MRPPTGKPYIDMDYGPFKTHSLAVSRNNIANKAVAIRLDPGLGGITSGNEFMLFETDTLRMAAGWTGPDFCNWRNIMHNGEHGTYASIVGHILFANPDAPGWAGPDGQFTETRYKGRDGRYYGEMDASVGRWKGLYVHGNQVVLSYQVGETPVLELPGSEGPAEQRVFTRTLNLGPRSRDLIMQVAHHEGVAPELRPLGVEAGAGGQMAVFPVPTVKVAESPNPLWINLDGQTRLVAPSFHRLPFAEEDFTIFARIKTTKPAGTIVSRCAGREQRWVNLGWTWFLRNGRLAFDVGWVGVVHSQRKLNDGKWHRVVVSYHKDTGTVQFYIDGQPDARGQLQPRGPQADPQSAQRLKARDFILQLGFTSPNFPSDNQKSYFVGSLADVRIYERRLSSREAQSLGRRKSEWQDSRIIARWNLGEPDAQGRIRDLTGHGFDLLTEHQGAGPGPAREITVAAVLGGPKDTAWVTTPDGHLRLRIPAGQQPTKLKVLISQVETADHLQPFVDQVRHSPPPRDLEPLTHGGPPHWTETVTTKVKTLGSTNGAFVVESIEVPFENPYHAMMRTSAFDFYPGGRRAAMATCMGDVWIVDGLGGPFNTFTWRRIASGMYEPMGLKIINGTIYVTCRDQITRLHDLNHDGEIDYYEAFYHGSLCSEHYHEFAQCLETDAEGNLYYVKAAGHNMEARFSEHGTLIKISPDGKRREIYAYGFRAPNGLWVSPDGSFALSTDQEGHWTPENKVNWIEPGKFYGYMLGWHEPDRKEDDFVPPLCWIHKKYDNSPSRAFFIESPQWGPLNGKMASISYGKGKVFLVMYEDAPNGLKQGGVTELPIKQMPTGLERSRFNPRDGQMYLCGLFVWCSDQTQMGGFYRVSYTGKPFYRPVDLHVARDGLLITFSEPLDAGSASDPGNYNVEMWQYNRRRQYGSADYRVLSPGQGHDTLPVRSAVLAADKRTVFLEIPGIRPVQQMHVDINLRAADGTRMRTYVHHTIHGLGLRSGREMLQDYNAATHAARSP